MSGEAAFVHDPSLEDYGFGEDHPFRPVRIRMTIELCESLGLLEGYPFVEAEPATDEDLTTVHFTSYVDRVKKAGRGEGDLEEDAMTQLKGVDFVHATLDHVNFTRADLEKLNFREASLEVIVLFKAHLMGADLTGADLVNVDLRAANLKKVDLRNARLVGIDLTGANLTDVDLRGAYLEEVEGFEKASFQRINYDTSTVWPPKFHPNSADLILVENR